jgi:CheY-like chemotaxis protein
MQPINILLAEDDQLDVIDIRRSLHKTRIVYQLEVARNGEEALTALNKMKETGSPSIPDLALIDINMPKMNGLELLEAIRSNEDWRQMKCFIITTSDQKPDRAAAERLGISGYLIKPLKLNSPSSIDAFNLMIDLINFKSAE